MITILRRRVASKHLGRYLEGQGHSMTLQQNRVRSITSVFEVGFLNYFTEIITILRQRVMRKFESLPWRSRSQHDLAAKSCPVHNFVIWSRILKLFHRHNHHIETTCRVHHLGRYLKGQGHSMTLQHNGVRPKTSLFEVGFQNYCTEMIIILRWRNFLPLSKTYSGSITRFDWLLFTFEIY